MTREFVLEMRLENEAFEDMTAFALAEILARTADHLRELEGSDEGKIRDINGNTVGSWALVYDEDEPDDEDEPENEDDIFGSCYEPRETSDADSTVYVWNPDTGMEASIPLPVPPHIADRASDWLGTALFGAGIVVRHINSEVDRDTDGDLLEVGHDEKMGVYNLHLLHKEVENMSEENLDFFRAILHDRKHTLNEAIGKARSLDKLKENAITFYHNMTMKEVVGEMLDEALSGVEWLIGYVDEEALAHDLRADYRETPYGVLYFCE